MYEKYGLAEITYYRSKIEYTTGDITLKKYDAEREFKLFLQLINDTYQK